MNQRPEIKRLAPAHLSDLNRLFTKAFSTARAPEVWEWKYFKNPHGEPVASVAVLNGEVIGFYGLLPRRVYVNDAVMTAYQEVDLMVDPDRSSGGLFKKLGLASYERVRERDDPFTFGFPNKTSLPLGRRILGWRAIQPIPLWTVLLRPSEALSDKIPRFPMTGALVDSAFKTYHAWRLRRRVTGRVREVRRLPEIVPATDPMPGARPFRFVRDSAYLQWRYERHPAGNYRYFILETDRGMEGAVVVGIDDARRANICDCLFPIPWQPEKLAAVLYHAAGCFRKEGCLSMRAWALLESPEARVFGALGFFSRNALNFHVIRSFRSPEFNRYLFDADRWLISSGDSDCV